jgi:hypothetical protein
LTLTSLSANRSETLGSVKGFLPVCIGRHRDQELSAWFAATSRLRTGGTNHLLAAAEATGVPHFVAPAGIIRLRAGHPG